MISVVTITFNNCEELKKTLSSIKGATDIESVVINGGQSQDTLDYLKGYSGVVLSEKDDGIADAFNKGHLRSSGIAVAYLNSGDVLIDQDYYAWANQIFLNNPDVAFTYSDLLFEDSVVGDFLINPRGSGIADLGKGLPFPHPTMIVRKTVFETIGGFSKEYKIAMDFDFVVRLLKQGYQGAYYPHATVRMDGLGVSSSRELDGIEECKKSLIHHGLYEGKIKRDFELRKVAYFTRRFIEKTFGPGILRAIKVLKSKV
jgi:glycosyltransferase involved in cell wall biosynthesis